MKLFEIFKSSVFFRFALVINGIGSCALAIAYPYFLLASKIESKWVFIIQAIIFSAAAIGTYLWAHILDQSKNIWLLKFYAVSAEIVFSILVFLSFNFDWSFGLKCLFIVVLQFLFAFEIPWSRIAFNELPENKTKDAKIVSQEITVAATLIGIFAPALGTLSVNSKNMLFLTQLNIFSFLPYAIIAYLLFNFRRDTQDNSQVAKKMNTLAFVNFIKKDLFWRNLFLSMTFLILSISLLMSSLPYILFSELGSLGQYAIPGFYLCTGLISTLLNGQRIREHIPEIIKYNFSGIIILVILSGISFFAFQGLIAKIISYSLFNTTLIAFNILFMNKVYECEHKGIHSRLFSVSQLLSRFAIPITSFYLSFFSDEQVCSGVRTSFAIVGVICILLFMLSEAKIFFKKKDKAHEGV
ncbi:MAG: hypothetical protein HQK52_07975 [Oligoflexia bacterium]|nr:hypothetical protein [Oligoflexia bacterium]